MVELILERAFRSQLDPRRAQERIDSRVIQEDHNAMSNLPQEGYQKIWQRNKLFDNPYLD